MFYFRSTLKKVLLAFLAVNISISVFASEITPKAVKGVIDLSSYDFTSGPVLLEGEWAFYWNKLAEKGNLEQFTESEPDCYAPVPAYWDKLAEENPEIKPRGAVTYHLRIMSGSMNCSSHLAIKFLNITPNSRIFINGKLVAENGVVDYSPEKSRLGNSILLYPVDIDSQYIDIIISISNFVDVKAGVNRPVYFGLYNDLRAAREKKLALDSFYLGGMFLIGIYQLFLFLLERKKKASLYMALLSFLALLFAGFKNEMVLLAFSPHLDGWIRTRTIYFTLAFTPVVFVFYASNLFSGYFLKKLNLIFRYLSYTAALLVLFLPMSLMLRLLLPLEFLMFSAVVYTVVNLIRGYLKSKDKDVLLSLLGLLFLFASIFFSMIENEIFVFFQSVAGVFFVFILYQAFLQAYIFSRAFSKIKILSDAKVRLEKQNAELFNLTYIDSLTNVCNRRLMDDFLSSSWRVNILNDRKLGLILINLDDFNAYNFTYGRSMGNHCLVEVCDILRDTINKEGFESKATLARYGGDEFGVIISGVTENELSDLGESLRAAVEKAGIKHESGSTGGILTISAGCAVLAPDYRNEPETLIDAAAEALLKAKNNGKNRCENYKYMVLEIWKS